MTACLRCCALFLLMAALMTAAPALLAQDAATRITGSAIVQPLAQALVEAAGAERALRSETTGSRTGLAELCAGDSGLSTSTQPVSEEQLQACEDNDVALSEFTLGHQILALIAHQGVAEFTSCLDEGQLGDIFAPSAAGNTTGWQQVVPRAPEDLALGVYVPGELTAEYSLLDALVSGDGLREDALPTRDAGAMVDAEPGAIAVTTLPQAEGRHILALDTASSEGCRAPSAAAVEDGLYPAAAQLLLYVNVALVQEPGVMALLDYIVSDAAAETVAAAGFSPPTEAVTEANRARLQAALAGEAVTPGESNYFIPEGLGGALRIGGAAGSQAFINANSEGLQARSPGLATTIALEGAPAGFRELCNGALDIVFSGRMPGEDEQALCAETGIDSLTIALGTRAALLLLANESEVAPACLTTAQLGEIWRAEAAGEVMRWSDLGAEMPDEVLTLFAPEAGSPQTDWLLAAADAGLIARDDVETNDDALYRAAATANVPGALTFMTLAEHEQALAKGQERIRLVSLDAGAGCVAPTPETIRDGSWPITQRTLITMNRARLTLPAVQAFLWQLASEDNFPAWEAAGFIAVRQSRLEALRAELTQAFDEATIAALERMEDAGDGEGDEAEASG